MNDNKNYLENLFIKEYIFKMILTVFKKLKKDVNIFQGGKKLHQQNSKRWKRENPGLKRHNRKN